MKSITLSGFRNGITIQFFEGIISIGNEYDLTALNAKEEFDALEVVTSKALAQFKIDQGSDLTDQISALDHRRELGIRTLRNIARAYRTHFDPLKKSASEKILETVLRYGKNVERLRMVEETTALEGLMHDLETAEYTPLIELIAMTDIVAEIKESNTQLKALWLERSKESSSTHSLSTGLLIKEAIKKYDLFKTKINALELITPSDLLSEMVARFDDLIDRFHAMQ